MALQLGAFTLHEVRDGTFALDGGAMFGVVPKTMWEKKIPADERNRIPMALRCLLIRAGKRLVLIDTGMGTQWNEKQRDIYKIDQSAHDLDRELQRAGVARGEITDVIITHLHFDHAGGAVRIENGAPALSFPNAVFHVQKRNWEWSHRATEKDRASFRHETFDLIDSPGHLHLADGPFELCPGIDVLVSDGHTPGLQLVRVQSEGKTLVYCADLIPTSFHLRAAWIMGYDLYPVTVIEEKKRLLADALENGWTLFFEHDPFMAACTVAREKDEAVVAQVVSF